MALMAFPNNAVASLGLLHKLCDEIWFYAGDRSVDVSASCLASPSHCDEQWLIISTCCRWVTTRSASLSLRSWRAASSTSSTTPHPTSKTRGTFSSDASMTSRVLGESRNRCDMIVTWSLDLVLDVFMSCNLFISCIQVQNSTGDLAAISKSAIITVNNQLSYRSQELSRIKIYVIFYFRAWISSAWTIATDDIV